MTIRKVSFRKFRYVGVYNEGRLRVSSLGEDKKKKHIVLERYDPSFNGEILCAVGRSQIYFFFCRLFFNFFRLLTRS